MRRRKNLIVGVVLAAILVFGILGGVALADNGDDNQPGAIFGALWEKVAAAYEQKTGDILNQEALKEAFVDARKEMRIEAMQNRLQYLVEDGTITQEQADEYLDWQKARPDVPFGPGLRGMGGMRGWCIPPAPVE